MKQLHMIEAHLEIKPKPFSSALIKLRARGIKMMFCVERSDRRHLVSRAVLNETEFKAIPQSLYIAKRSG